jgi:hypothetical protein
MAGWRDLITPNPKLKLLDQVREVMRIKHYSIRTEKVSMVMSYLASCSHEKCALSLTPFGPGKARPRLCEPPRSPRLCV